MSKIKPNEVFVYRNLHKNKISVKDIRTNLIVARVDSIVLVDCAMKVSEKGRQRVLKEKRKNVHAGVRGTWVKDHPISLAGTRRVTYNPYVSGTFRDAETGEPIYRASKVVVTVDGVFVVDL